MNPSKIFLKLAKSVNVAAWINFAVRSTIKKILEGKKVITYCPFRKIICFQSTSSLLVSNSISRSYDLRNSTIGL